jgi:hypothetical protein
MLQPEGGSMNMKTLKLILFSVFAIFLTTSLALAATSFKAKLSGKEEAPMAVKTKARGELDLKMSKDGKELTYVLKVKDIENATAAHIHMGKKGEEGAPVVGLFKGPKEGKFSGVLAKGTITGDKLVGPLAGKTVEDLTKMIKEGNAYVNVHTTQNPAGEIRGQLK